MVVVLFSNYACPLCCHSTVDMTNQWQFLDEEVAATQMPDEYRDMTVWVLCRDCHRVLLCAILMLPLVVMQYDKIYLCTLPKSNVLPT